MENKMNMVRTIKGTHDILPAQSGDWQDLETQIIRLRIFMATMRLELP